MQNIPPINDSRQSSVDQPISYSQQSTISLWVEIKYN